MVNSGQDFSDKEADVFQVDEGTANTVADVAGILCGNVRM
jgi:hypothetical protein